MKLLITRSLPVPVPKELSSCFELVETLEVKRNVELAKLEAAVEKVDVLICQLVDPISSELIKKAKNLKCIITYSVGLNHIDLEAAKKRQISVCHTRDVLTEATADLTFALLLSCARRLPEAEAYLRRGQFTGYQPFSFLGKELNGSTLGIIGSGRIGSAVAVRAKAFGMVVKLRSSKDKGSLCEFLKECDFVSLHCPLTPETKHLIGETELRSMKQDAVLINTSRGPVINETALTIHLKEHRNFYAGLDVYEHEPEISKELVSCSNAVLLPHIGSATMKTRCRMAEVCYEEAIRFAKGDPLQYEYRSL